MNRRGSSGLVLACAALALACQGAEHEQPKPARDAVAVQKAPAPTQPAAEAAEAPSAATKHTPDAPSIYELSMTLEDQSGQQLALDAFAGQPVVISMFYASCKAMCPLLITHLQAADDALSKEARAKTRFLLVSFDPKRDTPQKLRELAGAHGIDTTRWSLTRTSAASLQELAAVLDIRYRPLSNGEFAHSNIITVLDAKGVPVLRGDDSSLQPAAVAKAVERVMQAR